MAYEPESTALPTAHLEELAKVATARIFNAHFEAFQKSWQPLFRAWLEAHDRRILAEHGVTDEQPQG